MHSPTIVLLGHSIFNILVFALVNEVLNLRRKRVLWQLLISLLHGHVARQTHNAKMLLPEQITRWDGGGNYNDYNITAESTFNTKKKVWYYFEINSGKKCEQWQNQSGAISLTKMYCNIFLTTNKLATALT